MTEITQAEAVKELKRRHRDPLTGKKTGAHKNGHTDARHAMPRAEVLQAGTKLLVQIAHTPMQATGQVRPKTEFPHEVAWLDDDICVPA